MKSGIAACSPNTNEFAICVDQGLRPSTGFLSPQPYDYRNNSCLGPTVQAHDGRIQTVAGGGGSNQNQ
jgi:hypothetical protein